MRRLFKLIFWTFLFLIMLLGIDQFLIQVPPMHPAHAAVCTFYQDFRSRLIDLTFGEKKLAPQTIESVIAEKQKKTAPPPAINSAAKTAPSSKKTEQRPVQRYLYSDDQGVLQFVDSLEEIPEQYRELAQPMSQ